MQLLFGLLFVAALLWALAPWLRDSDGKLRLDKSTVVSLLLLAVGALLLWRVGLHGLAVAAGVAFAAGRRLIPALLRGLPLLLRFLPGLSPGARARGNRPGAQRGRHTDAPAGRRGQGMSREDALRVLGLEEGASREDVQREYKRLMKQVHPDRGGSSYLAAQVNEARSVLLAE